MLLEVFLGLIHQLRKLRWRYATPRESVPTHRPNHAQSTHQTSVLHALDPGKRAKLEYSPFLRSIHKSCASRSDAAATKPVAPCALVMRRTTSAVSASARGVGPWNLKKRLSFSGHLRDESPYRFVAFMKLSSTSSTHSVRTVSRGDTGWEERGRTNECRLRSSAHL